MSHNRGGEADRFPVGTLVVLKDLKSASHFNGWHGNVATGLFSDDGRVGVDMLEPWIDPVTNAEVHHRLKVKLCNVEKFVIPMKKEVCGRCGKVLLVSEAFQCGKCHMETYCSRDCQVADWKNCHQLECERLRQRRKHPKTRITAEDASDRDALYERFRELHLAGKAFIAVGDMSSAVNHFRHVKEEIVLHKDLLPDFLALDNSVSLMDVLFNMGRYQEAKETWEEAVALGEAAIMRRQWRGDDDYGDDDNESSFPHVKDSHVSRVYMRCGGILFAGCLRYDEGIKAFERAFELYPENTEALVFIGSLNKDAEKAVEAFVKYLQLVPNVMDPELLEIIADTTLRLAKENADHKTSNNRGSNTDGMRLAEKQAQLSIRCYERAKALDPTNSQTYDENSQKARTFLGKIRVYITLMGEEPRSYSLEELFAGNSVFRP
jgi:tetratricopeptide (TPR) repeat protein/ribosomal protein S27AE